MTCFIKNIQLESRKVSPDRLDSDSKISSEIISKNIQTAKTVTMSQLSQVIGVNQNFDEVMDNLGKFKSATDVSGTNIGHDETLKVMNNQIVKANQNIVIDRDSGHIPSNTDHHDIQTGIDMFLNEKIVQDSSQNSKEFLNKPNNVSE